MIDKEKVTKVCIDDFALKKCVSYGTIMVDIKTKRIIDLINSRDKDDVSKWLATYPNIKVVSRDGSTTYSAAIKEAHPKAIQVSDRFHLFKNIAESASKYLLKAMKVKIEIPATSETMQTNNLVLNKPNKAERIRIVKKLYAEGKNVSEISQLLGFADQTIRKYIKIQEKDIPEVKPVVREREHQEAIQKKQAKITLVKAMSEQGYSIYRIAKETGFTKKTIHNYLSNDCTCINGQYGNSRNGLLAPFREEVISLLSEGLTYEKTAEIIRNKGYTGSVAAIRGFITKERRQWKELQENRKEKTELISRKWLIKLLYKSLDEVKCISKEQFTTVIKIYPIIGQLYNTVESFKEIIRSKQSDKLEEWLFQVDKLEIPEIKSFVKGIERDINAVKNAIQYPYNNGLAEGSVNKLKIVKRIMYGRNSFDMLRSKLLRLELKRQIN